ncbi:hypothetical protein CLV58_11195 [Spirosoma oryzae]|uniref:Uncharacterized protein n=1 Tax=Spirosoma oryzae TaxID=1469603 RepID=A0A2T0SUG0_9BACT|nr:hypothetical protein CLV58_11195 [Spirosoma oryzae]
MGQELPKITARMNIGRNDTKLPVYEQNMYELPFDMLPRQQGSDSETDQNSVKSIPR